jgi:L,D-peptidoglycan transpeptidase YkuD (ErfK/YbiS/YcfS/YnhG family)
LALSGSLIFPQYYVKAESMNRPSKASLPRIDFRALNRRATRGFLVAGAMSFPAACGRSGRGHIKAEGDGLSPLGSFGLEALLYRRDRLTRPRTGLPVLTLKHGWGWCERPGDANYNRLVQVQQGSGHDELRRNDHLYDIIVVTSHNRRPRVQGRGSAIFFHLAREGFSPTAGCIAVSLKAMKRILELCSRRTRLVIH